MYWIVAYDVSCDRRRVQAARKCQRAGLRLQRSVFLVQAPIRNMKRLMRELAALLDTRTDHVAAWPLQQNWADRWLEAGRTAGPVENDTIVW